MASIIPSVERGGGGLIVLPLPYSDAVALTASTAKTYTFALGTKFVIFDFSLGATDSVWAKSGVTAVIPAGDTTGGFSSFKVMSGVAYSVENLVSISLVSSANVVVNVQSYT